MVQVRNTVAGLALAEASYSNAIELLMERYGNDQVLINAYMNNLMSDKGV